MSYQNEPAERRQTYKLGYWTPENETTRRVVIYSAYTRRLFTPRLGDRPAVDLHKGVASLETAMKRARNLFWPGVFEPVSGGWE